MFPTFFKKQKLQVRFILLRNKFLKIKITKNIQMLD